MAGALVFTEPLGWPASCALLTSSYYDFKKSINGDQFVFRKELLKIGTEVLSMTLNAAINWGLNKVISKTIVLLTGKNLSTLQKIVNVL